MVETEDSGYCHGQASQGCCAYAYLLPTLTQILKQLNIDAQAVFDLGCGNGAIANWLTVLAGMRLFQCPITAIGRIWP
jgi:methylase of polypeptide subunit release factors